MGNWWLSRRKNFRGSFFCAARSGHSGIKLAWFSLLIFGTIGVFLAGCASTEGTDGPAIRQVSQHLMGDQVLSLSISVPQASSIEQLAVGAKETVQPRNQVNVEGSVVSINGDVLVGNDARI